jgi:serine/threonine protein kinase
MSTAKIFRQGISTLLNSRIIEILSDVQGVNKALDLLKENFTFTAAEMAKNFQDGYGYALATISSGLATPENQQGFWKTLVQSNVNRELVTRIERDYLQPFAKQQGLTAAELQTFRQTAAQQCQKVAKLTLFQADNVHFSEAELASFVTSNGTSSITDLVLEQIQADLDARVVALLRYKELLGNAMLFFLHEQLRKDKRFNNTLTALQREGLMVDVREIKQIVQTTGQAYAAKQLELAQLAQQLERLQQVESVTQSHYAQFIEFSQRFADWAEQLGDIKNDTKQIKGDTKQILDLLKQLMAHADLSLRVKPRDELTQHSAANLKLIKKASQLLKRIPLSAPKYSRMAIGLGSVVSSQGYLKQAKALFTKAYRQASNNEERALSAFNLFQVFIRQQVYDKALLVLQKAIKLNPQRYALHNVHTYSLQRILGAGGMGCVFLAQHRLKNEQVVIKCFWETLHGSQDALFKEAFLMAKIAGEYVPQPLDCGFVDITRQERGYFISEYIEDAIDGETWLKQYGKLDIQTGIAVGLQIAKGLQLAHDKGIFHLDLKPANILLQRQNADEIVVKIIDFGLAKVAPSLGQEMVNQHSRSGLSLLAQAAVFGTMNYAPPEQQGMIRYGKPSAKSDVYAFGKTLYRLLTEESPQTFLQRRLANAPELFELLSDCVEIDPEKRIDVATLISRLTRLLRQISQPQPPQPIKQAPSPKPAPKPIQPEEQPVQIDKREWWNRLDDNWKMVFKRKISIEGEPTDSDLEKIVNLQTLDLSGDRNNRGEIASLEPLRALTKLQTLNCKFNKIKDLEPLRTLKKLQTLGCSGNKIKDLEPLRTLTNLQTLHCSFNQISDLKPLCDLTNLQELACLSNKISYLEPLRTLKKLRYLDCSKNKISNLEPLRALINLHALYYGKNKISDLELDKFKKAVPDCKVYS